MNIWNAFPFVRYAVALIIGVLLNAWMPELWEHSSLVLVALVVLVLMTAFFFRERNLELFRVLSGLFTLALIVVLGGWLAELNDESKTRDHYQYVNDRVDAFSGVIVSDHFERDDYFRYVLKVEGIVTKAGDQDVSGKIHLYMRKDSLTAPLSYGNQLFIRGGFFMIDPPKNPDAFNYKKYLARKNIFAQSFVSEEDFEVVGHDPPNPVLEFAYQVRTFSSRMISDFIPGQQEAAVLNALLIGVKDYLDTEIKEAYSAVGAMHVLAVSGLHVGIVYLLITLVFGPLKKSGWGNVLFLLISLSIIWCYALITGFSPSVMRASTMFSVIILGESSKKSANIYNSLGLSAFILLLYNPYFVFEVGFQLSFIAVLGIVLFQPPIYRVWSAPNKLLDYFWAIISVSIAAQLVTFPLSILYFHQFPTYFLLSNIIIIPSAMVMLTSGLFMLGVGAFSSIAGETIGFLLGGFVELINWVILGIQQLPYPTVDWIYLSGFSAFMLYLFMLYFYQALNNYHFRALIFSQICLILLFTNFYIEEYQKNNQERIVVYHTRDGLAIDLISGRSSQLLTFVKDEQQIEKWASFSIDPHRLVSGLQRVSADASDWNQLLSNGGIYFTVWHGKRMLVVEPGAKGMLSQEVDAELVVFQHFDPKLIDNIRAEYILIGPMTAYRDREAMIKYFEEEKIDYFDIHDHGAFVLDIKDNNQK